MSREQRFSRYEPRWPAEGPWVCTYHGSVDWCASNKPEDERVSVYVEVPPESFDAKGGCTCVRSFCGQATCLQRGEWHTHDGPCPAHSVPENSPPVTGPSVPMPPQEAMR